MAFRFSPCSPCCSEQCRPKVCVQAVKADTGVWLDVDVDINPYVLGYPYPYCTANPLPGCVPRSQFVIPDIPTSGKCRTGDGDTTTTPLGMLPYAPCPGCCVQSTGYFDVATGTAASCAGCQDVAHAQQPRNYQFEVGYGQCTSRQRACVLPCSTGVCPDGVLHCATVEVCCERICLHMPKGDLCTTSPCRGFTLAWCWDGDPNLNVTGTTPAGSPIAVNCLPRGTTPGIAVDSTYPDEFTNCNCGAYSDTGWQYRWYTPQPAGNMPAGYSGGPPTAARYAVRIDAQPGACGDAVNYQVGCGSWPYRPCADNDWEIQVPPVDPKPVYGGCCLGPTACGDCTDSRPATPTGGISGQALFGLPASLSVYLGQHPAFGSLAGTTVGVTFDCDAYANSKMGYAWVTDPVSGVTTYQLTQVNPVGNVFRWVGCVGGNGNTVYRSVCYPTVDGTDVTCSKTCEDKPKACESCSVAITCSFGQYGPSIGLDFTAYLGPSCQCWLWVFKDTGEERLDPAWVQANSQGKPWWWWFSDGDYDLATTKLYPYSQSCTAGGKDPQCRGCCTWPTGDSCYCIPGLDVGICCTAPPAHPCCVSGTAANLYACGTGGVVCSADPPNLACNPLRAIVAGSTAGSPLAIVTE